MYLPLSVLLETLCDALFLSPSEKELESVQALKRWRDSPLEDDGQTQLDSNRNYLLLGTKQGLFLVQRKQRWQGLLDPYCEQLYEKRGRRAFARIHAHLLRNSS